MQVSKSIDQHIAVFGESGSGKTVLISSFYGPTQERGFKQENLYSVSATNAGQHAKLHKNYLGMRDSGRVPTQTRYNSHAYTFKVTPESSPGGQTTTSVDHLKFVWHDYPGEWFESDVSNEEEAQRRIDTFRALMVSDVALLLVDAQRLIDNAGEEERYLKSLFGNFRHGLDNLRDDILTDGKRLVEFPRIWVIALSKADLLPDLDVWQFRDLVTEKAGDEIAALEDTIKGMVEGGEALSVGRDFAHFSSAKFELESIDVKERIGLDLILPMAMMLPFERHAKWAADKAILKLPNAVIENLEQAASAVMVGILLLKKVKLPGPIGALVGLAIAALSKDGLEKLLGMAKSALEESKAEALRKKQYFAAVLVEFRLALVRGEEQRTLLKLES